MASSSVGPRLGVDWSREAVGQEPTPPTAGAERSNRRERDGVLRRRGLLPPRETAVPTPGTEAPPYDPNADAEPRPYVPPGVDSQPGPVIGMEELSEPIAEPTRGAVPSPGLLGRYQVSAYGSPSGHGCYIVDTMTGRTWHVANGQPPQVVADALRRKPLNQPMPVPTTTDDSPASLIVPTQPRSYRNLDLSQRPTPPTSPTPNMAKFIRYALATVCFAASVGCLALWWRSLNLARVIDRTTNFVPIAASCCE